MKNKIWKSIHNSICGLAYNSLESNLFASLSFIVQDPVKYSVNDSAKNLVKKMNEKKPR